MQSQCTIGPFDWTRPIECTHSSKTEEARKSRLGPLATGAHWVLIFVATGAQTEASDREPAGATGAACAACAARKKTKRPDSARWLRYQSCIKGRGQSLQHFNPLCLTQTSNP